ncbi:hypothetical protein VULLAG_LOCUS7349 [Vulpes lagopus]
MYQHLKLSPPAGRALCSPPDAGAQGGRVYPAARTDTVHTREADHLGGVETGDRSGDGTGASFAKGVIAHSVWCCGSQHHCPCETRPSGAMANPLREARALLPSAGLAKAPWVGFLSLSGNINASSEKKKFCFLQCWKWGRFEKNATRFLFGGLRNRPVPFEHRTSERMMPVDDSFHFLNFPTEEIHIMLFPPFVLRAGRLRLHALLVLVKKW